jgi:hypothetical protein
MYRVIQKSLCLYKNECWKWEVIHTAPGLICAYGILNLFSLPTVAQELLNYPV